MSVEINLDVDEDWLDRSRAALDAFHDILAVQGLERGLIGPREVPRLWPRHLINCLCVADPGMGLLPPEASVADIGSGAGLPGLVWALARPDLTVTLVEPLQRRTTFLTEASATLGLTERVRITQARAQDLSPMNVDVVTSRALARLDTVVGWSLPHLRNGGALLAIKGGKASRELAEARESIEACGGTDVAIIRIGPVDEAGQPLATVVRVAREVVGNGG
ncbi:MAG: rRNA (guanine527-N7)-methyltransferase [Actinomycetota bacterium]|nr:rRNA (guanine527-N7)-methyltransferase [Actinomycetota bacterium]